jgi:hypothetical protein
MGLKFCCGRNLAFAITANHQQPFALLHYCGIGDLPSVASEAQTNGSPMVQGQDYRVDSPEVSNETTATTLVSHVMCGVAMSC